MKLAIYIPTESPAGTLPEYDRLRALALVKRTFAETYGGYTQVEAVGGWMGSTGLVEEQVTIVYTFTDTPDVAGLRALGRVVATRLDQDAVAVEHSGDMEFIGAADYPVTTYDTPQFPPVSPAPRDHSDKPF